MIEIRLGQGSGEFRESLAEENQPMIPVFFCLGMQSMENENILIIEDDEDTGLYLKFFIGKKFQIYLFSSTDFYFKYNDSIGCSLIILDLSIRNKIDGEQIIKKIKSFKELKNLPLICISAQTSAQEKERTMSLGADEFLLKPVTNEKLMKVITNLLARTEKADLK